MSPTMTAQAVPTERVRGPAAGETEIQRDTPASTNASAVFTFIDGHSGRMVVKSGRLNTQPINAPVPAAIGSAAHTRATLSRPFGLVEASAMGVYQSGTAGRTLPQDALNLLRSRYDGAMSGLYDGAGAKAGTPLATAQLPLQDWGHAD